MRVFANGWGFLWVLLLFWGSGSSAASALDLYQQAEKALLQGKIKQYHSLRQKLDSHPLAIYLDYRYLEPRVRQLTIDEVLDFQSRAKNSPLESRLVSQYLSYLGSQKKWNDFLKVSPQEPSRTKLRCYYNRALLAKGKKEEAFQGASGLWLSGNSQPKACDPLFKTWQQAGFKTNQRIWERMLLAFNAREFSLLSYLNRSLTVTYQTDGERLIALYRNPKLISHIKRYSKGERAKELVSAGLTRLARTSPRQAIRYWRQYEKKLIFATSQATEIKRQLVHYAYAQKDGPASQWADQQLKLLQMDDLTERRLRQLLREGNWQQMNLRLSALSSEARKSERWQYWLARIEQHEGVSQQARLRLKTISDKRSYYSYLAASELGTDYQLTKQSTPFTPASRQKILRDPGYQRVVALQQQEEPESANSEWVYLLRRTSNDERLAMANLALEQQWWHLAISAAIKAKAWHDLDLRFPQAFSAYFQSFAQMRNLDSTLLMAIARRESTYNPHARSSVGARGIMQLMPATAKATARKIKLRYRGTRSLSDPNVNIRLGSAYLQQLLKQFNNNKILAIAAYNAGPHRVKGWLNDGKPLPFDIWIETIPFRETREYVQAVLAYQVIYQQQLMPEAEIALLSRQEESAVY